MSLLALGLAAIAGVAAGVLAGLFGIGGGAVLVPLLYVLLERAFDAPASSVTVVAHATSLAIIVPTAVSAMLRYQASSLIPWRIVGIMGMAAAVVALLVSQFTPAIPQDVLRGAFAIFLVTVASRMLRRRPARGSVTVEEGGPERTSPVALVLGGSAVGVVSAALGVGGGTLAIPVLMNVAKLDVRRVAAASMGVVAIAALAGSIGYLTVQPGEVPAGTIGCVFLPGVLVLTPGAIIGARFGADLNARIAPDLLRRLFALLLFTVAARLVFGLAAG